MIWELPPEGALRKRRKFCWLPWYTSDDQLVWLGWVVIEEEYCHLMSGNCWMLNKVTAEASGARR